MARTCHLAYHRSGGLRGDNAPAVSPESVNSAPVSPESFCPSVSLARRGRKVWRSKGEDEMG